MSINHLVFDTTSTQTILDSSNVGAYVRANDGTLITKHSKGLAAASVVYDTVTFTADFAGTAGNSIALVFDGVDDIDTVVNAWNAANPANTVSFSGQLGTYVPAAGTATLAGGTDSHGLDTWLLNPSIVVTATNLDIRDLNAATDSVSSWTKDGVGNSISSTGGALDVNLKSPVVVDVKLDGIYSVTNTTPDNVGIIGFTRAVTPGLINEVEPMTVAAIGAVASGDVSKIHALDVNAFLSAKNVTTGALEQLLINDTSKGLIVDVANTISVSDVALANSSIATAQNALNVANTAENVVAAPLAARKYLFIQNIGNLVAYIGSSGVNSTTGYPIFPGSEIQLRAGAAVDIEWVSANTNQKLATLELA